MIAKISELKSQTANTEVQNLCESTIQMISSAIYNGVTTEAQLEIERVALTNLFEQLEKFSNDKLIKEWVSNQKRLYTVKHIGVRSAVNKLIEKEAKYDCTLAAVLEDLRDKLEVIPEVKLYESFISAMSGFNHIPAVSTELNALSEKVSKYKNDIDISKIIETMKETRSNYLLPLIEDVVNDYLNSKTEQSKHILKETLVKFSYDPFIRDIINIVSLDATNLQLEYADAACYIEDKLWSPIIYLGEGEVLFNVKGTYYLKKGNNINKIKKDEIVKIDESFKNLCSIINLPNVEITKKDIKFYAGNDNAFLSENETYINNKLFSKEQINECAQNAQWAGNESFYSTVSLLRENFNDIAELDFVKRVYLKENENYAADIFKLRDNIFITTFDPINAKATFYRNINPIQADKIMMEHMRFDVSKTFRDILPNKEKILSEINETKKEYTSYIAELQSKIISFSDYTSNETTNAVIIALNEELEDVKNDYKNYLNEVEKYTNVSENLNITVQDDSSGKSYTVVVPTGAMAAKGESGTGAEGAEGDSYGTEVGMSNISGQEAGGAASAVTFDDDSSELISDSPSIDSDKVDLGADDVEAYADKVDAEAELEKPEDDTESPDAGIKPSADGVDGVSNDITGEESELGDTASKTSELDLSDNGEETSKDEESEKENPEKEEEAAGAPNKNLERTNFNKDKNPNDLEDTKKPVKKVYLKRPKQTK